MLTKKGSESDFLNCAEEILRRYRRFSLRELQKRGIELSNEQKQLLQALHQGRSMTQKQVADSIHKDPASVTRMLDLLEKGGLVVRVRTQHDRRSILLSLTAEGQAIAEKAMGLEIEIKKYAIKNISPADLEKWMEVGRIITDNLE